MVRTRALAWMVGVALLALGALGGCSGSVGGDHPGTREVSGLDMRTGGEPVRVHAYLEQGGHYYDLTAGDALSGAGDERVSATSAVESVADREWLPYPSDICMFQEVVVPSLDAPEGVTAYIDLHGETPDLELPAPVHAATGTVPVAAPLGTASDGDLSLGYMDVYSRFPTPVALMEPGTTILRSRDDTPLGVSEMVLRYHSWTEWDEETQQIEFYYTREHNLYWNGEQVWSWASDVIKGKLGSLNIVMGIGTTTCGPFTVTKSVQTIPTSGVPGPEIEVFRKVYRQRRLVLDHPFQSIEVPDGQESDFRNQGLWLLQDNSGSPVTLPVGPCEGARYRILIRDATGNLVGDSGICSGSELAWTWEGPPVAARGTTPGPYRLVPADFARELSASAPATTREEDPADDFVTYTFEVEMSARIYPDQFGAYPAVSVASGGGTADRRKPEVRVRKVRFGGGLDLEPRSWGPFPVYDYQNDLRVTEPGWTPLRSEPAVYRAGEHVWVGADLLADFPVSSDTPARLEVSLEGRRRDTGEIVRFLPASAQPMTVVAWSDDDSSRLVFRTRDPLPASVGRYPLELTWSFHLTDSSGQPIQLEDYRTPSASDRYHMVYTVLDTPITLRGQPALAALPWYNEDTFDLREIRCGCGQRSPLDLATEWARGAASGEQALDMLTRALYEKSGLRYQSDTGATMLTASPFGSWTNKWLFSSFLDNAYALECSEASNFLRVLSSILGVPSIAVRIEPAATYWTGTRRPLWTTYIRVIGAATKPYEPIYFAPPSVTASAGRPPSADICYGRSAHEFLQVTWAYHQVLEFENRYFDAVVQLDNGPASLPGHSALNPKFHYLNQCNLPEEHRDYYMMRLAQLLRSQELMPSPIDSPQGFIAHTCPDYSRFMMANPLPVLGLTKAHYSRRLFYLDDQPTLQKELGYDSGRVDWDQIPELVLIRK